MACNEPNILGHRPGLHTEDSGPLLRWKLSTLENNVRQAWNFCPSGQEPGSNPPLPMSSRQIWTVLSILNGEHILGAIGSPAPLSSRRLYQAAFWSGTCQNGPK